MKIDIAVETETSSSTRARQVSAMFDCPVTEKCRLEWKLDFPLDDEPWNVGLVVGPSGSGKTTVMRHVWGEPPALKWGGASVVDDFDPKLSMELISSTCGAVGFNTIPAWMRPFRVLSNGEQFRVDLARRLSELADPIVVDEFTSVVDRQVAQIGSDRTPSRNSCESRGGSSSRSGATTTSSTGFSPTGFWTWRRGPSPGGYFSDGPLSSARSGAYPTPRGVSSLRITT